MRHAAIACSAAVLLLLPGCIRSLHPFYTEQDLVFDPALIGSWADEAASEGDNDTWVFSKGALGDKDYRLVVTDDKGKKGVFTAYLLKIKGTLFLDLYPERPGLDASDFYKYHLIPAHTFAHVKQISPTLQMRFPNPDWLEKQLAAQPDTIAHEILGEDEIILTAPTKALQDFWIQHLATEDAFGNLSDLKPRAPAVSQKPPASRNASAPQP